MKIKDLVKMLIGIALVVALVVLCCNVDLQSVKDWFTSLTTEKTETATDVGNQLDTPTVPAENTTTVVPEVTEEPSEYVDNMGKTYFYNEDKAYRTFSLQERLDLTAMTKLNVYDVVRQNDIVIVDDEGQPITADYGIDLSDVEAVAFFRDGYSLLSYDEDEDKFLKDESSHIFKGASDSEFTDAVFCDKDAAIKSRVCVGYVNATLWGVNKEYGCKGWFKMNLLESRIFKAFVLVRRAVVLDDGRTASMFTWAVRVCDGEVKQADNGGNGDGGKPSDKPTAEPTIQPTAEPTTKPTHSPTEAPTTAPTEAPTTAPTLEPTVRPTHSPTEPPRPTHSPTDAPTAAPTEAPTKEPTPSYKPTPAPEVTTEPTATNGHSPTDDQGSGNSHSPTDDDTSDDSTSGGNRHSDADDSSASNGNKHSEP